MITIIKHQNIKKKLFSVATSIKVKGIDRILSRQHI